VYWCCAQVEPRRERLASHCLALAGYEIYQPLLFLKADNQNPLGAILVAASGRAA
jgi:hypothetical protein